MPVKGGQVLKNVQKTPELFPLRVLYSSHTRP